MGLTVTNQRFPYYRSKEAIASLGTRLRDMFKTNEDNIFSFLLEKEFLRDLALATYLASLSEERITPEQQMDLNSLRDTYFPKGDCPSHLFSSVSKKLQEEYGEIHKQICGVLYDPSLITPPQN